MFSFPLFEQIIHVFLQLFIQRKDFLTLHLYELRRILHDFPLYLLHMQFILLSLLFSAPRLHIMRIRIFFLFSQRRLYFLQVQQFTRLFIPLMKQFFFKCRFIFIQELLMFLIQSDLSGLVLLLLFLKALVPVRVEFLVHGDMGRFAFFTLLLLQHHHFFHLLREELFFKFSNAGFS